MSTPRPYSVSEILRIVNFEIASRFRSVAVEGEVSNFVRSSAGHCYFSIKDSTAQLRVVLFVSYASQLRFRLENGLKVVVRGKLEIYPARGEFQLQAIAVDPAGLGALQLAFEQLKERLANEGLFDEARKRAIPMLPQRIAIVTSPTGAAIRDILHVLGRRFHGLEIQIFPVRVQGTTAAAEIARAIDHLSRWARHDVVLVCRGGGSLEDLWSFNEEVVARAIAASSIPVITGVGHETDFTIADFVADRRAPTPSAAAEIVVQAKGDLALRIDHAERRIRTVVLQRLSEARHRLRHFASTDGIGRVPSRVRRERERLGRERQRLYERLERRASGLRRRLADVREPLVRFPASLAIEDRKRHVSSLGARLARAIKNRVDRERDRVHAISGTLDAVSPLSVLARGYAIAFDARDGRKLLTDSAAIGVGDPVDVRLKRGSLRCTVDAKTLGLETLWPDATPQDDETESS